MRNIKLVRVSDNKVKFEGIIEYSVSKIKQIEHDGEIYTKNIITQFTKTIEELRIDNSSCFRDREYLFDEIDFSFSIEDYVGFTRSLCSNIGDIHYSDNDYVNAIHYAFDGGFLDKRILDISSGRRERYFNWDSIIYNLEIWFPFIEYGFNNSSYYKISMRTFLELPIDKKPKELIEIFKKNGIDLNTKNIDTILIQIINKKADYEASKQQKFNRISI